jgi:GNAT superfamily N-acetyltransferase
MRYNTTIRPIQPDEATEAKELVFQVAHELMEPETPFGDFKAQWNSWGVFNDMDSVQTSYFENGGVFLVSVCDGQIVGTGAFLRYEAEGYCELKRITLVPEYRGQGLGYAMIMELIGQAQTMGYSKMILWTNRFKLTRAVALYRQIGFVEVSHEGADEDEIWMEIALALED